MTTKGTPNQKTSAVNKTASSGNAVTRFLKNISLGVSGAPVGIAGTSTSLNQAATSYFAATQNKNKQTFPNRSQVLNERLKKSMPKGDCQFNLPPIKYSLPVRAIDVIGSDNLYTKDLESIHKTRRGIIWFYDNGSGISTVDDAGAVTTAKDAKAKALAEKGQKVGGSSKDDSQDFNYGFQFLWNPENISQAVARNMDVTPSSADRLRSVSGAFPGQESVQFSIVLDRVNDFASLRGLAGPEKTAKSPYPVFNQEFLNLYQHGYNTGIKPMNQKLYELSRYGTMADLEYLFKAINGAGPEGGWVTLLGKKTADIGFLSPTLLAFRFGPNPHENLSFVGWITNLSINHTAFTEEMIPLRTTVNFSVDCFAGSSIVG